MTPVATARLATLGASTAWHLGLYRLSVLGRGPSQRRACLLFQRWSRQACALMGVDVHAHGQPSEAPCIYVSNHRSYLDIPVLASVLGASFLSRADVADWPVIGYAARAIGAVFVDRDDPHGRVRAALALKRSAQRARIVVFPEGTTGGARLPSAFAEGVFRLLRRIDCPVVPVTIRYGDRRAYWIDEVTIGQHVRTRALSGPRLKAVVHIGTPLPPATHTAAGLAAAAYGAVCEPIEAFGELVKA